MQQEYITIPFKEWKNLEKNSLDLFNLTRDLDFARQEIELLKSQREELKEDIRYWIRMYQSANARADKNAQDIARCTEVHERERNSHLYNQAKR
ncbi:hypothetical protein [Staphylococcus hominis]|uniref:hypothetical protein n=1 Tax=Staphylococcus hominis TaxID=1290 RepID=UPI001F58DDE6|nr:hypothetical protein [Staphylococcus hominis]MCI2862356.1 hypothetical protein [Staphylococcus hominis]MCI2866355.1 hypothetical protein [Staphylococcus hominis]MCI2884012.1 hypothetical protein [Staphylococcus hominis]